MSCQFIEDGARNLETPLGRLIRVSRGANRNLFPALDLFQLRPKKRRCLLLDENLPFEVRTVPQFHELVGVACIAILASKLTPAIRIDRPRERQIAPAHHAAEQRSRPERKVLDLVSLAQRFTFGGDPRDADKFRVGFDIGEQRE